MADQKDFMDLAEDLMDPLYAYARRLTLNDAEAEDLLQDTYLRAYTNFSQFAEDTNLRAWMYRIMTNRFIDTKKRLKLRPAIDDRTVDDEMADIYLFENTSGVSDRTSESAEMEFLSELPDMEIKEALESLPEHQRIPVLLADIEGFSYQEIADFMDVPLGTVMSRLHRGRKTLFEELYEVGERYGYVNRISTSRTRHRETTKEKIAVA